MQNEVWSEMGTFLNGLRCGNVKRESYIQLPELAEAEKGGTGNFLDGTGFNGSMTEGYIAKLSTQCLYDENGQTHYCADETLRKRLETKLITKILDFEIA